MDKCRLFRAANFVGGASSLRQCLPLRLGDERDCSVHLLDPGSSLFHVPPPLLGHRVRLFRAPQRPKKAADFAHHARVSRGHLWLRVFRTDRVLVRGRGQRPLSRLRLRHVLLLDLRHTPNQAFLSKKIRRL